MAESRPVLLTGAVVDVLAVVFILVSAWSAFIQYGRAAGGTPTAEPAGAGAEATAEETHGAGTTADRVAPNTAVPDDRLSRSLPAAGQKRSYRAVIRDRLRQDAALTFGAGMCLLWYGPAASVGPAGGLPAFGWPQAVAAGVALGLGLKAGLVVLTRALAARGLYHGTTALVERMRPTTASEVGLHFLVVLPAIAVGEELWFRGVLVAVAHGALGLPLWLMVPFSAVVFGMPHREQGRTAVLTTGIVGLVLGGGLVATGSLLLVVAAHYTLNATTFGWSLLRT